MASPLWLRWQPWPTFYLLLCAGQARTQGRRARLGMGSEVLSVQRERPGQSPSEAWVEAALAGFISCGEKILNTLICDHS